MDSNRKLTTPDLLLIAMYECFGVAIITFTIVNMHILNGQVWSIPLSWIVAQMIAGHVSEGHFNPAVSFAICLSRARDKWWTMIWWYWLPQFFGVVLAHYILKITLPDSQYGPNSGAHGDCFGFCPGF